MLGFCAVIVCPPSTSVAWDRSHATAAALSKDCSATSPMASASAEAFCSAAASSASFASAVVANFVPFASTVLWTKLCAVPSALLAFWSAVSAWTSRAKAGCQAPSVVAASLAAATSSAEPSTAFSILAVIAAVSLVTWSPAAALKSCAASSRVWSALAVVLSAVRTVARPESAVGCPPAGTTNTEPLLSVCESNFLTAIASSLARTPSGEARLWIAVNTVAAAAAAAPWACAGRSRCACWRKPSAVALVPLRAATAAVGAVAKVTSSIASVVPLAKASEPTAVTRLPPTVSLAAVELKLIDWMPSWLRDRSSPGCVTPSPLASTQTLSCAKAASLALMTPSWLLSSVASAAKPLAYVLPAKLLPMSSVPLSMTPLPLASSTRSPVPAPIQPVCTFVPPPVTSNCAEDWPKGTRLMPWPLVPSTSGPKRSGGSIGGSSGGGGGSSGIGFGLVGSGLVGSEPPGPLPPPPVGSAPGSTMLLPVVTSC